MTTAQAAKHLKCSARSIRNWADEGILETVELPGYTRFVSKRSVDRLVKRGKPDRRGRPRKGQSR